MQAASIAGTGNTVVQIVGDGNSVTTGHPYLTLTRYIARRHIRQELDRLSPYARSTPLLGRETELASLHAFLSEPRLMLARVLVGGGGSGKTRLALELCEQASATGWNAGFVTRAELHRFFCSQNLSDWGWQKPTLIVVDYAAEHAGLLSQWLDELADRAAPPPHVLRLLLLERNASTDTGWWTTVFASGGWGATSKRALLDPPEPVPIRPLAHAEDRLALLGAMLAQASSGRPIAVPVQDAAFRDKLMQLAWGGDPLFLMMAALAMVQVGHARALALSRTDLADAVAGREADRLQQLARGRSLDPVLVQHLAACITLAQGMSREDFERFASSEKATINRPSGGDAAVLADVLQQALPRTNGIAPVLPDLIGEALIVRTMRQDAGATSVLRCHAAFGRAVAESVIRCAQDFAQQSPAPLQWLEGIIHALGDDEDELAAFGASLPIGSVVLRDFHLKVAERLQTLCAEREDAPMHSRAAALYRLAMARTLAGQLESGLEAAQKAAHLYRELAAQRPDVFRPDLAKSLDSLGNMLTTLGEPYSAWRAAQEALDIRRDLAAQRPDEFRPALAASLNNLVGRLGERGELESALQAAQEATELCRVLAAQRPDVFRSGLAISLHNLASCLGKLGQHESALQAAQEAVELCRALAAQRPDEFRHDLAMSLHNLVDSLSALGQHAAALQALQEAANIRRALAAQRPDEFRHQLVGSLHNLAARLGEMGQHAPALQAAQEAVELCRALAAQRPDEFLPALAISLIILARLTCDVSSAAEALPFAQEAVTTLAVEFPVHRAGAHVQLMLAMHREYLQLCESAGRAPDLEQLGPLLHYFADKECTMLDIATLTALSSSAVTALTPLLKKAVEKGAEELAKSSANTLFEKLKQRLSHVGAKEALDDLAEEPDDAAAQGALNMQLRKALAKDPELAAFLKQWVTESQSATGTSQNADVAGDHNKVTQIVGSGNSVG